MAKIRPFTPRKVYQIMDADSNYRSILMFRGEPIEYVSKKRRQAMIYTYDEAKNVAKYFIEKRNVPVMIECRNVTERNYL